MKNLENQADQILEAITDFAGYIVEDRKIQDLSVELCEEIAKHALQNLSKVMEAYELGKARA
jgi:hypothetical protein